MGTKVWIRVLLATALSLAAAACQPPSRRAQGRPPHSMERSLVGAAWDDPLRCAAAVGAGAALPRSHYRLRLATWSLSWFPDGAADHVQGEGSNVDWLACVLAWLDVDVVTLQRLRLTSRGLVAMDGLLTKLKETTHVEWRWQGDTCAGSKRAHVAVLWRVDRVQVSLVASHPEIDVSPHTDTEHPDCPGELMPALGLYVKSLMGGVDFHLVTFELAAGENLLSLKRRQQAWRQIGAVVQARERLREDSDVVIAAAFSSVGSRDPERYTSMAEREELTKTLAESEHPLVLVEPADSCTEYAGSEARETDFMVVSAGMQEAKGLTPRVGGLCGGLHCQSVDRDAYVVLRQISSHCPLLFDLNDRDEDE